MCEKLPAYWRGLVVSELNHDDLESVRNCKNT